MASPGFVDSPQSQGQSRRAIGEVLEGDLRQAGGRLHPIGEAVRRVNCPAKPESGLLGSHDTGVS